MIDVLRISLFSVAGCLMVLGIYFHARAVVREEKAGKAIGLKFFSLALLLGLIFVFRTELLSSFLFFGISVLVTFLIATLASRGSLR